MHKRNTLSQAHLKKLLYYNPETGEFNRIFKGAILAKRAGTINNKGYRQVGVDYEIYLSGRLAWLYMKGYLPLTIDHINRVKSDDRFENLREATYEQNNANRGFFSRNTSGYKGVIKIGNRWRAAINFSGRTIHLGVFDSPEEARDIFVKEHNRLHPGFSTET